MIPAERRRHILTRARAQGVVSIRELIDDLNASEATLRRDLRDLAAEGLLRRTRGGAVLPDALVHEPTYDEKVREAEDEKRAIAAVAVSFIGQGDSIMLGPGTTTLALAQRLRSVRDPDLTVVTNSLLVAGALQNASDIDVVVTGGSLRRSIHALVGPTWEDSLGDLGVDTLFLSGNGVSAQRGLTTPDLLVAAADRALVAIASRVIVLADYTKIGNETMCQTVPLDAIDTLITDPGASPDELERIRQSGVDVHVADLEMSAAGPSTDGLRQASSG